MLESVKVDRDKLLATLRENREKHVTEYDEAVTEYRVQAEKALRKRAIAIRDGETLDSNVGLPIPRTYVKDYDQAIAMVEWSAEDVIELEDRDFNAFVRDEWAWSGQFVGTTSLYNHR